MYFWWLPNVSVEVGNKREISDRNFLRKRKLSRIFNLKRYKIYGYYICTATSTSTKGTAIIVFVLLVVVILSKLRCCFLIIAIIMHIATRHYRKHQNVESHKICKKFHWGKDNIKSVYKNQRLSLPNCFSSCISKCGNISATISG